MRGLLLALFACRQNDAAELSADALVAVQRLSAAGETPVDAPDLAGSWIVRSDESGFASTVQRRRLAAGVYEVDVTLEVDAGGRARTFLGRAIEAFGPARLCMRWVDAGWQDAAHDPLPPFLSIEALDAQPCQQVVERTATVLRLDNGRPYVERRP